MCFGSNFENQHVAASRGGPSSLVDNCVSVITGDYYVHQNDYVTAGYLPIQIPRIYLSSSINQDGGWGIKACVRARRIGDIIYINEPDGTPFRYAWNSEKKGYDLHYSSYSQALTNICQGQISARNDPRNHLITYEGKHFVLHGADGSKRRYRETKFERDHGKRVSKYYYALDWEQVPNGNASYFTWDKHALVKIEQKDPTGAITYSSVEYKGHDQSGKHPKTIIHTSDHKRLVYRYTKLKAEKLRKKLKIMGVAKPKLLKSVESPDFGTEEIKYKTSDIRKDPTVISRTLNDKCPIEVEYYTKSHTTFTHIPPEPITIKISESSPLLGRVKFLKQPTGENGNLEVSKTFVYHFRDNKASDPQAHSWTNVYDCLGNLTTYRYNKDYRLYQVEKLDKDLKRHCYEHTTWNGTRFKAKTILNSHYQPQSAQIYDYDKSGNVKCEKLWGCITGERPIQLQMRRSLTIEDAPKESTGELAKTHRTFTANNLLQTETNPSGLTVEYTYFKNTDLISAKYYLDEQKILKRQFFEYDKHHILIQEIEDDGSAYKKSDLTDVSVRRIKEITPDYSGSYPGLPILIKEGYQDQKQTLWFKQERYTYNGCGLLETKQIIDSEASPRYTLHYTYDERSRLISETNSIGQKAKYQYDENSNCIYEQKFDGTEIFYIFDACNRCTSKKIKASHAKPRKYHYTYNRRHELSAEQDHLGNVTHYRYDLLGQRIQESQPAVQTPEGIKRSITRYQFDVAGNKILTIDPNGNKARATYNAYGKPLKITHSDGAIEQCTYYLSGNLKTKTAPNGTQTHYTYDVLDRPLTKIMKAPSGETLTEETFTYTAFNLYQKTDAEGNTITYGYDLAGRKTLETHTFNNGHQEKTSYEYDSLGRLHKTIHHADENTLIEIKEHDNLGRVIEERTEDLQGNVYSKVLYKYDQRSNKTQITHFMGPDNKSAVQRDKFDGFSRLLQSIDPEGNTTTISYDESNNRLVKTTVNPKGLRTVEVFDALNHLTEVRLEDSSCYEINKEEFSYDPNGNKISQVSRIYGPGVVRSTTTNWEYDPRDRLIILTEAAYTDLARKSYTEYTPSGKKARITKPDGMQVLYDYDGLDRVKRLVSADGSIDYVYSYNKLSQVIEVIDAANGLVSKRRWDPKGRLLYDRLGNGFEISRKYDARGRCVLLGLPKGSVSYQYGSVDLEAINRLDTSGNLQYSYQFLSRDLSGNILSEALINNLGETKTAYNLNAIPISYDSPYFKHEITKLDPNGNILEASQWLDESLDERYAYNILDQLLEEQNTYSHTYDYDSHHNRVVRDQEVSQVNDLNQLDDAAYDWNGNPTKIADKTCEYDALDRLVAVHQNGKIHRYTYDYLHRRISSSVDGQAQHFLYDDKNEIGSANAGLQITELRVIGRGGRAEIASSVAFELRDQVYAPLHDLYGNVRALVNQEGLVVETYEYDAFGKHEVISTFNPWRSQSKRCDSTGFVCFGRRYYVPELGRFLTPDPLGLAEGPNLYQYLHGNPLLNYDEYGLLFISMQNTAPRSFEDAHARASGFIHGCIDFGRTSFQDIHSQCFYFGMIDMGSLTSIDERMLMMQDFHGMQQRQKITLDSGVQRFLGVDVLNQEYVNTRKWTHYGLEAGAIAYGGYSLAKGISQARRLHKFGSTAEKLAEMSVKKYKPFKKANCRYNLTELSGISPPSAVHAHHVFPQKFLGKFSDLGINIHDPQNLLWWNALSHLSNAKGYNDAWNAFFEENERLSRQQVLEYGKQLMKEYEHEVNF